MTVCTWYGYYGYYGYHGIDLIINYNNNYYNNRIITEQSILVEPSFLLGQVKVS